MPRVLPSGHFQAVNTQRFDRVLVAALAQSIADEKDVLLGLPSDTKLTRPFNFERT